MPRQYKPPIERFWKFVHKTESCWLWTGQLKNGYGFFRDGEKQVYAHRFSYEAFVGPIPDSCEIDHVRARGCTHRNCVRPDHLEAVTHLVNMQRAWETMRPTLYP